MTTGVKIVASHVNGSAEAATNHKTATSLCADWSSSSMGSCFRILQLEYIVCHPFCCLAASFIFVVGLHFYLCV